jgi:hypothetical protein
MNGRSYYKWILHLLSSRQADILYTKAHSAESSIPSILNASADYSASKSQHIRSHIHRAPLPTFFMDHFTFFTPADGWIEPNIRGFTDRLLSAQSSHELELKHGLRLVRFYPSPILSLPTLPVLLFCTSSTLLAFRTASRGDTSSLPTSDQIPSMSFWMPWHS